MTARDKDFFSWSEEQHLECVLETRAQASHLNADIRALAAQTAALLDLLFSFATCSWGCAGRSHFIEGITGKCVSSARAAFRLLECGHYDEALTLTRSVAEVANLFLLFLEDHESFKRWVNAPSKQRAQEFSPVKVRLRLEELEMPIAYDEVRYRILCEAGVHANPEIRPQSHNRARIQTLGGIYQERGYVRCLVELAYSVATAGGPAPLLTMLPEDKTGLITQKALALYSACEECGVHPSMADYQDRTDSLERLMQWCASRRLAARAADS